MGAPTLPYTPRADAAGFPQEQRKPPRIALLLTGLLLFIAASAMVFVLSTSMLPSRARASGNRVPIPTLAPGQFAFVDKPLMDRSWTSALMFVRLPDGRLKVFELPTYGGRYTMPDLRWDRPGGVCRRFEPDFARGELLCKEAGADGPWLGGTRWTLEGRSLHPNTPDLLAPRGRIEGEDFILAAG